MALLTIKNLEKRFNNKKALDGLDLTIEKGRIVGLLGPNGSGKTTLLKAVAGMLEPDSGEIEYPDGAKRGIESKSAISFLPDSIQFPAWMRVSDAFRYWSEMYPDYSDERAGQMASILSLDKAQKLKTLSKGQLERVSLGLVFSRQAKIYLLDEPMGGIDPVGKQQILESIITVDLDGASILLSTHLVKDVERLFDDVYFISEGKIIFSGDCDTIRSQKLKTVEEVYLEVFSNV